MDTLFAILKDHGKNFTSDFWHMIFRGVLRPLFDEIHFTFQSKPLNPQLTTIKNSCHNAFNNLSEIFNIFFNQLQNLLNEIIEILMNCIQNTHEVNID